MAKDAMSILFRYYITMSNTKILFWPKFRIPKKIIWFHLAYKGSIWHKEPNETIYAFYGS